MADREKIINDLNVAKIILFNTQMLTPEMCLRVGRSITSAIDLLKEQEPKPVKNIDDSEVGIRNGFCPECQKQIYYNILHPAKFCKYCGQAVKWE